MADGRFIFSPAGCQQWHLSGNIGNKAMRRALSNWRARLSEGLRSELEETLTFNHFGLVGRRGAKKIDFSDRFG